MRPREVLARVLEAGGRVVADPERPRLLVPPGLKPLVSEHREALRQLVLEESRPRLAAAIRPDPETLAHLLTMPLDQFARDGQPLEVRVSWWPETLFFVPSLRDVEALGREGVVRPRVWTARELIALLSAGRLTTEALLTVMIARQQFGGEVVAVYGRSAPPSDAPHQSP